MISLRRCASYVNVLSRVQQTVYNESFPAECFKFSMHKKYSKVSLCMMDKSKKEKKKKRQLFIFLYKLPSKVGDGNIMFLYVLRLHLFVKILKKN